MVGTSRPRQQLFRGRPVRQERISFRRAPALQILHEFDQPPADKPRHGSIRRITVGSWREVFDHGMVIRVERKRLEAICCGGEISAIKEEDCFRIKRQCQTVEIVVSPAGDSGLAGHDRVA